MYLWINAGSYSQHLLLIQIPYFQNIIICSAEEPMYDYIWDKTAFFMDTVLRVHAWISWKRAAIQDKSNCSITILIAEEIEVVTGKRDHMERQSKTKVDKLNARFDSVWK